MLSVGYGMRMWLCQLSMLRWLILEYRPTPGLNMQVFSICEVGVNHLGSYDKALRMIRKAKDVGASAVKFQKYNPIKVLGKNHPALNDAHQLSWEELTRLSNEAHRLALLFGVSVFNVNDIP